MSVAEQAVDDLNSILRDKRVDPSDNRLIAALMQNKGWHNVDGRNICAVARDLGFKVKGKHIYEAK